MSDLFPRERQMNAGQSEENTLQAWEQTDQETICVHRVARTSSLGYSNSVPTGTIAPTFLVPSHVQINAAHPSPIHSRSRDPRGGGGREWNFSWKGRLCVLGPSIESHSLAYRRKG